MALKQDKYKIEVQNDDAINHNRIFFDFMQQTFNFLDGLYLHKNSFDRYNHRKSIEEAEWSIS